MLGWVLHHRGKFFLILLAFIGLTVGVARWRLKLVLFPPGLIDQFFIQVDMPHGTGLTESGEVLEKIERIVMTLPPEELEAVTGNVGLKGFEESIRRGTRFAQLRVFLTPEESRPRQTEAIVEELRRRVTSEVKGPEKIIFDELHPGPPVGKAVQVRVRGRDLALIEKIVEDIKSELRSMDGVVDIEDSRSGGKDQLRVVLDRREAAFAGLDVARVAQNVLFAVDGGEASEIRRPSERDEIDIKVRLRPEQRSRPEEILALNVLNDRGRPVRLGAVAEVRRRQGPPFIERYNFRPVVTVTADVQLDKVTSREANTRLMEKFKNISRDHPGYELVFGGEEEETRKSLRSLGRAFFVGVLLDFVILASVFASYAQPFIILLTIPIGMLGVVYALLLHGQPASFMALLGIVAMTGVVVNNAIVLVSFINRKRAEGMDVRQAAIEAGATRLRPIWASSITTLLGLFPTAYGFGGYEPFVAPMALSLAWGLTIAMPMTLFLIPMATVLADDAAERLRRARRSAVESLTALFRRKTGR
jgi:multidrug efflux pump subunit AcrB